MQANITVFQKLTIKNLQAKNKCLLLYHWILSLVKFHTQIHINFTRLTIISSRLMVILYMTQEKLNELHWNMDNKEKINPTKEGIIMETGLPLITFRLLLELLFLHKPRKFKVSTKILEIHHLMRVKIRRNPLYTQVIQLATPDIQQQAILDTTILLQYHTLVLRDPIILTLRRIWEFPHSLTRA